MKQILNRLFEHQSLSREEAAEVMLNMASGKYNEAQIAAFITVYLMRSIDLEELTGFRDALLSLALPINLSDYEITDIVGTGGDGKNTFNISTAACFAMAGAGYQVAKHGNYGATSVSGSSNVLEYFGAKFTTDESILKESLDKAGFAYLHAPIFNPAMKHVAPLRKNLGVRTFFNMLGPLISPARPGFQCLGVYNLKMMRLYNYIYQHLGINYSIVHSLDGYDEVSLTSSTMIINGSGEKMLTPEEMGFKTIQQSELFGGNTVEEAATIFSNVLDNKATNAQRDAVIINAAFAIQTRCPLKSLQECEEEAAEALFSGEAKKAFTNFIAVYSK